ncbi:MAG: TasA family protein [Bacillota bacterium]
MKTKIYLSLLIIALASALVGGATFALFTDTATNADNTFATGTVDVSAGDQNYSVPIGNMAPGDNIAGTFTVTNSGTLKIWFKVTANASGALFTASTCSHGTGPAAVAIDAADTGWIALDPGASQEINYTVSLPLAADNCYQGVNGTLSFTVDAEQWANNPNPENP